MNKPRPTPVRHAQQKPQTTMNLSFDPDLPFTSTLTGWFCLVGPDGEVKTYTSAKSDIKEFYQPGDTIVQEWKLCQLQGKPISIHDL